MFIVSCLSYSSPPPLYLPLFVLPLYIAFFLLFFGRGVSLLVNILVPFTPPFASRIDRSAFLLSVMPGSSRGAGMAQLLPRGLQAQRPPDAHAWIPDAHRHGRLLVDRGATGTMGGKSRSGGAAKMALTPPLCPACVITSLVQCTYVSYFYVWYAFRQGCRRTAVLYPTAVSVGRSSGLF